MNYKRRLTLGSKRGAPTEELNVRSSRTDQAGITHIRYNQLYKGVTTFEVA
jgi:Zn-dependent metalloprotease